MGFVCAVSGLVCARRIAATAAKRFNLSYNIRLRLEQRSSQSVDGAAFRATPEEPE